ncbi:hypothetical protein [Vreelandella neptunia]|uniref:Uncharacterized protein n=1 Tax=Vreelandella neptunia TaxID=115551 RepID=A0ABS9S9V9_9GAMM|nr:hypothetical protein [Halomonas neptunia]MCH4812879.1 hypothetical protein [Halomonas neptunia]
MKNKMMKTAGLLLASTTMLMANGVVANEGGNTSFTYNADSGGPFKVTKTVYIAVDEPESFYCTIDFAMKKKGYKIYKYKQGHDTVYINEDGTIKSFTGYSVTPQDCGQ